MDSLFIVSLPRSLSSLVYQLSCKALALKQPSWTSDGEIMNVDRYLLYPGPRVDTSIKFVAKKNSPKIFRSATDYLDQVTMKTGFGYKDVVHPFVMSAWLECNSFPVLRIKRCIADVAYSMLERKWYYPRIAADTQNTLEQAVIEGLIRADEALDRVQAECVDYEELIYDQAPLTSALARLYPRQEIAELNYLNHSFAQMRARILERRSTVGYKRLKAVVDETSLATSSFRHQTGGLEILQPI